jgi:DNA polymerase (family 10)
MAAVRPGAGLTATEPINIGRAWDLADRLTSAIALAVPDISSLEPAGDLRRAEPLVSAIVLVGRAPDPAGALHALSQSIEHLTVLEQLEGRLLAHYHDAIVDVRLITPDQGASALFMATGSEAHVAEVVLKAGTLDGCSTEEEIYARAGLPFITPELRHHTGEIDAALSGRLPSLVDLSAIRGDLHMHSSYSDGRNPVAIMVDECHRLGYEYMAITDHSWGARAARTLAVEQIARQRDELDALREQYPAMRILHGIEVDILPHGRLDFTDAVLEQFDIVLASLHDHARQSGAQLTARSVAAIRHPLVNILCHPANRLVGRTSGYAMDFDAIYAAAAETGTALEIDGAPSHMDLDGAHARAAVSAGAWLTIDSDCHRVDVLARQMRFGVGTARRGWVEARHVLNTRPVDDVLEFVAAKRRS